LQDPRKQDSRAFDERTLRRPAGEPVWGGDLLRFTSAFLATAILVVALYTSSRAAAQVLSAESKAKAAAPNAAASTNATPALTQSDLDAWFGGFLPYALQRGEVAGALVVVVKDDAVLFAKGYGYADVAKQTPVDPERTLFRFGSVSKLFTWTAVMQLVEQNKIDLDRDVNEYLDFKIEPGFGKPVTMRNLMTHTAGFEEHIQGIMAAGPNDIPALGDFVKANQPPRIYPPGEVPAYSNYGAALAGYIVQRVSGEDFVEYLEHHIFAPLGMQHTTFRQPLPEQFAADMSKGYQTSLDAPNAFELCGPVPAGAISGTGADLARFMIAHLKEGQGLLQPGTARLMHDSIFKAIPPLNGMALGFFQTDRNGHRIISHGGDTVVFHSDAELLLDDHAAILISVNSRGQDGAAYKILTSVFEQFMDRYFPAPIPEEPTAATAKEHAELLARTGQFRSTRRSDSAFFSILGLFDQEGVSVNPDNTIVLPSETGLNGQPKVWHEIAPFVWREMHGKERLAVKRVDGKVALLGTDSLASSEPWQPVPALRSSSWNVPLLVVTVVVLVLTLISWIAGIAIRRHYGLTLQLNEQETRAFRAAHLAVVVDLLFCGGWVLIFMAGMANFALFAGGIDRWVRLVQSVGLIAVAGAAVALWNAWLTCRGSRGLWTKLWSVLLAASTVAVVWFAFVFHLITLTLHY
jgi:CubicO group peptidase (beta-lactamase class C family)